MEIDDAGSNNLDIILQIQMIVFKKIK